MNPSTQRIVWLTAVYRLVRRDLLPEAPATETVALAYSFPHRNSSHIGQYHHRKVHTQKGLILVNPRIWDSALQVAAVLCHEIIHATYPKAGHRGDFVKGMHRCGLEGRPTATVPGFAFEQWFDSVKDSLPEFPRGALKTDTKKQTTRLRKWVCPCGVIARVASDDFQATCNRCDQPFERG